MMGINVDGAFLTIRESLKSMITTDWGRVIGVSSVAAARLKARPATRPRTRAQRHDQGAFGGLRKTPYTFNSLCPAYVDTDIISRNVESISKRAGVSEEEARHMMVGVNPHGRLVTSEEVAEAAMFLCGAHSGSMSGQTIQISGGEM